MSVKQLNDSQERKMRYVPVKRINGSPVRLRNTTIPLVRTVVREFCSRYTSGGTVLYIGDAGDKFKVYERDALAAMGVVIDEHGKMPDVIVHFALRNWLILIEAVTSHGPVNIKRHNELKTLFKGATPGLVFITAFEARKAMVKYLGEIAWETEVWVAEAPTHLIHFNGERFLGPYPGGNVDTIG